MSKDEGTVSRVTRTKAEAKANYDRLSRWYDLLAWSERKAVTAGLDLLNAQAGETILEIGYGTGRSLVVLARAVGPTGHVYGIDISEGMCRVAERRLRKANLSDRVTLTCGDAVNLPYDDGTLDGVFLGFVLELFDTPEIPIVLRECQRVLRSGGRIAVVAMHKQAPPSLPQCLYEYAHSKLPRFVDCRPIDAGRSLAEAGLKIAQAHAMRLWGLPVSINLARNPLHPSQGTSQS